MINYTDILGEAYEDNHVNFVNYFHLKEKFSVRKDRIEIMYFEWFLAKAQIVERDFFIDGDSFIQRCLNQCTIVLSVLARDESKKNMITEFMLMFSALDLMCKAIDEAPEDEDEAPEDEAPEDEAEADNETPKRDLSKFNELFVTTISKEQKDSFKKDIDTFVDGYTKNQIVALAFVLHDLVHQTVRPKVFKTWLEMFCAIIGKKTPTAKQSKPKVKAEIPKMKQTYYYLFPKNSLV